jgi:hypothetical protein
VTTKLPWVSRRKRQALDAAALEAGVKPSALFYIDPVLGRAKNNDMASKEDVVCCAVYAPGLKRPDFDLCLKDEYIIETMRFLGIENAVPRWIPT